MQKINEVCESIGTFYEKHFTSGIGFYAVVTALIVSCAIYALN